MIESTKTQQNEEENEIVKSKHRSPNYPYIGLAEALDRTKQVQVIGRTHFVPVTAARDAWQYKTGTGNQVVAALRAYGLIEIQGEGEKRQIRVSDLAAKILDSHSQKADLIKEAALKPELHRELWDRYKGDLPHSSVIREYLRWERNFNPANVDKFIEQFRESLAFAHVTESDKIYTSAEPKINSDEGIASDKEMLNIEEIKIPNELPTGRVFKASIEVLANGTLDVIFAGSMNSVTVSLLKDIYDIKEKYESKAERLVSQNEKTIHQLSLLKSGE